MTFRTGPGNRVNAGSPNSTGYDLKRCLRLGANRVARVDFSRFNLMLLIDDESSWNRQPPNRLAVRSTDVDAEGVLVQILQVLWESVDHVQLFSELIGGVVKNLKVQLQSFHNLATLFWKLRGDREDLCVRATVFFYVVGQS